MVDSMNASALEALAVTSRAMANVVGGDYYLHYPQGVDKSQSLLIKENKRMWISHTEQIVTITWNRKQIKAFKEIIYLESRWNPNAYNPSTNAYGLGQLVNSKTYTKGNPYKQINAMVKYIFNRYGTPNKALQHHKKHGWY
jgi:hypothetical protein